MVLVQSGDPGAWVVGGQTDLERERLFGVVEDQVDLVFAVAPVVEPDAGVEREQPQCRSDEVLEENAELGRIVQRRKPSLEGGVPDSAVDEVELAAALLHCSLPARVVRQREDQEGLFEVGEVAVEGRLGEAELAGDI